MPADKDDDRRNSYVPKHIPRPKTSPYTYLDPEGPHREVPDFETRTPVSSDPFERLEYRQKRQSQIQMRLREQFDDVSKKTDRLEVNVAQVNGNVEILSTKINFVIDAEVQRQERLRQDAEKRYEQDRLDAIEAKKQERADAIAEKERLRTDALAEKKEKADRRRQVAAMVIPTIMAIATAIAGIVAATRGTPSPMVVPVQTPIPVVTPATTGP